MPLDELKRMIRIGQVPRTGVTEFMRKFRHLLDPATYQSAIDLHERVAARSAV
jgi:hypothetical protein